MNTFNTSPSTMTSDSIVQSGFWTNLPSIGFWTGSTALTGNGVYESVLPVVESQALSLAISIALTSTLTFTGYKLFRYAGTQAGKREKPGHEVGAHAQLDTEPRHRIRALVAGASVLAVSSWFSFSSLVFLNFGDNLQQVLNDTQQEPLIARVRAMERYMTRVEQDTAALSRVAANRAAVEAQSGGQCVASGPGRGPIAETIDAHAAETAQPSALAKGLRQEASMAVDGMRSVKTQAMANAVYAQAQRLVEADTRGKIAHTARMLRDGYAGAGFRRAGRTIICPRGAAAMIPVLERVIAATEAEVDFPDSAPVFRRASLLDAASRQLDMLLSWGKNTIRGMDTAYLLMFALIALGLDLSGAWTAHFAGRLRGTRLSPKERRMLQTTAIIMEDFIWDTPARYKRSLGGDIVNTHFNTVMVMPTEDDDENNAQILRAARRFAASYELELDRTRAASDLRQLPSEYSFLNRRLQRYGLQGQFVDLYMAPPETWRRIRKHRDVLRLLFGQQVDLSERPRPPSGSPENVTVFHHRVNW